MNENLNKYSVEDESNWIDEAEQDLRQTRVRQKSWKVALRVLTLLREKGLSQTELAELMEVSRQQVTKIVKGKENLTLETIDKLEQALGVTLLDVPSMPDATSAPVPAAAFDAADLTTSVLEQLQQFGSMTINYSASFDLPDLYTTWRTSDGPASSGTTALMGTVKSERSDWQWLTTEKCFEVFNLVVMGSFAFTSHIVPRFTNELTYDAGYLRTSVQDRIRNLKEMFQDINLESFTIARLNAPNDENQLCLIS